MSSNTSAQWLVPRNNLPTFRTSRIASKLQSSSYLVISKICLRLPFTHPLQRRRSSHCLRSMLATISPQCFLRGCRRRMITSCEAIFQAAVDNLASHFLIRRKRSDHMQKFRNAKALQGCVSLNLMCMIEDFLCAVQQKIHLSSASLKLFCHIAAAVNTLNTDILEARNHEWVG